MFLSGTECGAPGTVAAVQRSNQPLRTYVDVLQPVMTLVDVQTSRLKAVLKAVLKRPSLRLCHIGCLVKLLRSMLQT